MLACGGGGRVETGEVVEALNKEVCNIKNEGWDMLVPRMVKV